MAVDGRIILKLASKIVFLGVDRTFLVQVRNYKLLKNDFDSRMSELVVQSV